MFGGEEKEMRNSNEVRGGEGRMKEMVGDMMMMTREVER